MYGLSGASRSGKTTLAKKMAEVMEVPFVDSSTTALMQQAGFNPVAVLDIETRIEAQEHLLQAYLRLIDAQPSPYFVTDRTPMDMLAYMLAEVSMHNTTFEQGERINAYCENCIAAAESRFSLVLLVHPLSVYEVRSDKPPLNRAYQGHIHLLIEGALRSCEIPTMRVKADTVENRMTQIMATMVGWRRHMSEQLAQEVFH